MSGPKGIAYQVQAAEEARRRALQAARDRCAALDGRLAAVTAQLAALTDEQLEVPAASRAARTDSVDSWQALERALTTRLHELEDQVVEEQARRVREQFAREFGSLHAIALDPLDTNVARRGPVTGAEREQHARSEVQGSLARAVLLMQQVEDGEERRTLARRGERVEDALREGALSRARQHLLALQSETNRLLVAQRSRDRIRQQAENLALTLATVPGPSAEGLRTRVRSLTSAADLTTATRDAQRLLTEYAEEQDRVYVVEQTRKALIELGYEIGEEFDATSLAGQPAVVTRPDLPDHGLRLQFVRPGSRLLTRVVTFTDPDPVRDAEVETTTCGDVEAMRQALNSHGVTAELDHHRAPGEVPMTRTASSARARKRRADRARER